MADKASRILVIEQDSLIRELLCEILASNGLHAMPSDRCLAPDDVRRLRPHAILIDPFTTSEHAGWAYLRLLREHPGLREVPVVLCTAAHEWLRNLTSNELELISTAVLKPFDIDELLEAVLSVTDPSLRPSPFPWLVPVDSDTQEAGY